MSEDEALEWLEETSDRGASRRPRRPAAKKRAAAAEAAARADEGRRAKPPRSRPQRVSVSVWAVLVAAGRGERLGEDRPKAFVRLGELPLLAEPLRRLDESEWIDAVVVVAPPEWEEPAILLAEEIGASKVTACVTGGETRTGSVRAGRRRGARRRGGDPRARRGAAAAARRGDRARCSRRSARATTAPCRGCRSPTRSSASRDGVVVETLARDELVAVQTPQAFVASVLRAALARGARAPTARRSSRRTAGAIKVVDGRRAAAQGDDARRPRAGCRVAVEAVVFDVGETLVDETTCWIARCRAPACPPFTLMARARRDDRARPRTTTTSGSSSASSTRAGTVDDGRDWYPDALPCLARAARARATASCASPATRRAFVEEHAAPARRGRVGSSESWGVEKPSPAFFARVVAESRRAA